MHKFFLSALCALAFAANAFSQKTPINFLDVELDSVYKIAKAENKLVFVDCYTTWCGPCKWMDANVFTDERVVNYFNENFISVKLDMEAGEGEVFAGWYEVRSYPTYIFLDVSKTRKELVHRVVGSMDSERFIQFAKDAQDSTVRIGESRKQYANGERSPEFIKKYLKELYDAGYSADLREIAFWHYKEIDWSSIDSVDAQNLLLFISNESHPYYATMMAHMPDMERAANQEMLYSVLYGMFNRPLWMAMRSADPTTEFNALMVKVEGLNYSKKDKIKSMLQLDFYAQTDLEKYFELAPNIVNKYLNDDSGALNSIAWNYYEHTKDKKKLKDALTFIERSIQLEAMYNNMDTKMRLLYASGNKKGAIAYGNEISQMIATTPSFMSMKDTHEAVMNAMKAGKDISEMN